MSYCFPFGQKLFPLTQQDTSPKKVFVLGVYASAVHARWKKDGKIICQALAVASEPRIFWDGDPDEAENIIKSVDIPKEVGTLEPANRKLNGPSAKVLDENILAPLGYPPIKLIRMIFVQLLLTRKIGLKTGVRILDIVSPAALSHTSIERVINVISDGIRVE